MATLPSYAHPAVTRTAIYPGMVVTDGHRRMVVKRISDADDAITFYGVQVVLPTRRGADARKAGPMAIAAGDLVCAGVLGADTSKRLGLPEVPAEVLSAWTAKRRRGARRRR